MNAGIRISARAPMAAALVLLAYAPAFGLETGEITAQMRTEDPRLEKRISLRGDRWYVGELCEHIARLAGVSVAAHDRDGAADPRVIAVVSDMALADAMNALRSLLSYEGAPYIWGRLGDAPGYRYVLCRSLKAQRLAGEIVARVQADFEAECSKLLRMCRLPEDEIKQLARTDPLADNMVKFPRDVAAWQMLGDALAPDTLAGIIRDGHTLTLPVADLTPSGRHFVDLVWSEGRRFIVTPEGGRTEVPEPKTIRLYRRANPHDACPGLMIGLEHAGAYAYAGGVPLARRTLREHTPGWILAGDRLTDPREDAVVPRPSPEPPEPADGPTLAFRLAQLADAGRISVLLRVPTNYVLRSGAAPYGQPLSRFLDALGRRYASIQCKWTRDALLVSSSAWYR